MDDSLILFSKKLKILRNKRKLTLEKLAEMAGISTNHLSKLEAHNTKPSFTSIVNLANALDVELKELFNFDELKDASFIRDEFEKLLKYSNEEHLKLLYKIHKDLIN